MGQLPQKLGFSVLYVEDESDIRENISKYLSRRIVNLHTASDGMEGLELYRNVFVDMVISDIRMPKMDGLEMIRQIKKINPDAVCVVTSAHTDTDYLVRCIELGVSGFLFKPIMLDKLEELLIRHERDVAIKKELHLQRERFRTILDFQESLVVLTNGESIIEANRRFLDFFGFTDLDDFYMRHRCVSEFFVAAEGCIDTNDDCWLNETLSNNNDGGKIKAKMRSKNGEDRIFVVNAKRFPGEERFFVVSFTDITEIEKEAKTLERLATTDSLTGAYNRMKFDELFTAQIEVSKRYPLPMSLIMFDIDHFKSVNDTFGHKCGDRVLIELSRQVSKHIRSIDIFSRWGGEEFMVLAPNTSIVGAINMAENLRVVIEQLSIEDLPSITCSFGVVEYHDGDDTHTMFARVDKALYKAKENGRNRVETD